jgi:ribose transport system ATP-binding protein
MADQNTPILKVRNLSKSFTRTRALDNVSLDCYPGEIHALLGENGAGKSTLIKILVGLYRADSEDYTYNEKEHCKLQEIPISVIHQDLGVIDSLSVMENIAVYAGYKKKGPFVSWKETAEYARELLSIMKSDIDPRKLVAELTTAEKSIVAISRTLALESKILLLDESTATLSKTDVDKFFTILKNLAEQGMSILFISHRLDEVMEIADRVTILRNGKNVYSDLVSNTSRDDLIYHIVGKALDRMKYQLPEADSTKKDALVCKGLSYKNIRDLSFNLVKGEILSLFGLIGSGHYEIGRMMFGELPIEQGEIYIDGEAVNRVNPQNMVRKGLGFVSSKRLEEGVAVTFSVRKNMFMNLATRNKKALSFMNVAKEKKECDALIDDFSIVTPNGEIPLGTLSGGNQQKVVLAKWMASNSKILVLEEPTMGVDVGAKADIYQMIIEGLRKGNSVLLISSDFEEVTRISHRVIVFNQGKITAELKGSDINQELLTKYSMS